MSGESYKPPFTMTDEIANLIIEIGEYVGRISAHDTLSTNLTLRRENRIRTIHSSLAIEQNSLSLDQVSDVINGKHVLAPPQDIREVKNAYEAYEHLSRLNPYSLDDLLKAHYFMMNGLVEEAGCFRSGGVGVYAGNKLIHTGTPARYVPEVMNQLFNWMRYSRLHPLVKSCIFHYEFEFIHPFSDGNGRTGRLWHSLILQRWKSFFAWLPIETLIHEQQDDYYQALNESNTNGESTIFVEFMLTIIRNALIEILGVQNAHDAGVNVGANVGVNESEPESICLSILRKNPKLSAQKIADQMGMSARQVERLLAKLKKNGQIERIGAAKNGYWKIND